MDSEKLLMRLISLILLIFLLNFLAMKFYWYLSIWYFDMPMHFLGGIWLGLASIYFFPLKDNSLKSIFKIFFIVLLVGVGWEVFEILVNKFTVQDPFNFLDTVSDICFDLAGGLFAIFYFIKKVMFVEENAVQLKSWKKLLN
jgi:hypothetical protein